MSRTTHHPNWREWMRDVERRRTQRRRQDREDLRLMCPEGKTLHRFERAKLATADSRCSVCRAGPPHSTCARDRMPKEQCKRLRLRNPRGNVSRTSKADMRPDSEIHKKKNSEFRRFFSPIFSTPLSTRKSLQKRPCVDGCAAAIDWQLCGIHNYLLGISNH